MAEPPPNLVLQAFRFKVTLTRSAALGAGRAGTQPVRTSSEQLGDGGFQECTGLDLEADIKEYLEGGRNDSVIRRVGRVKLQPLVLKRGMFAPSPAQPAGSPGSGPNGDRALPDLWLWFQDMVAGRSAGPTLRRAGGGARPGGRTSRRGRPGASSAGCRSRWPGRP